MASTLRPIDVARKFQRSVAWLYTLERKGIIPSPTRDPLNGRRVYSSEDVTQIRETLIARANGKG